MADNRSHPTIDYRHVMRELSVNRNSPCEIVRELISNGYDAQAKNLWVIPLIDLKGLVFIDDGTGVSSTEEIREITPWQAFFSIGRSTKPFGKGVGYKCQGSKLCFASRRFGIVTKCQNETKWRYIFVENPKDTLDELYSIDPGYTEEPWDVVRRFYPSQVDARIDRSLSELNQAFFLKELSNSGTVILVNGLEAEDFATRFKTFGDSFLREYIRFRTKHGDMRILRPEKTGFSDVAQTTFNSQPDFQDDCRLHLWTTGDLTTSEWSEVSAGFPYLKRPDDWQSLTPPAKLSRLGDGSFFYRNAHCFKFNEQTFSVTLVIDGWKRVRDDSDYRTLSRRGRAGSGLKLADQRGAIVCSAGVPIGPINEIFEETLLADYAPLGQAKAQNHFAMLINGQFELVTNRDTLAENARSVVLNKDFLKLLKDFLDESRNSSDVFDQLVSRLSSEAGEQELDGEIKRRNARRDAVSQRDRFLVKSKGGLKDQYFLEPDTGEENLVAALYSVFAYFVEPDSEYSKYWYKLRTLSGGEGIDSFAVSLSSHSLDPKDFENIEFKWRFSPSDEYNHALILTDRIVAWEIDTSSKATQVRDRFDWYGDWKIGNDAVAGKITTIAHVQGKIHESPVEVVSLKELIKSSFDVEFINPPPWKKGRGKNQ